MVLLRASADDRRIRSVIYVPLPRRFRVPYTTYAATHPKSHGTVNDDIYLAETLAEFQHVDNTGHDVGADVRARARDSSRLLADDQNLAEVRWRRKGIPYM